MSEKFSNPGKEIDIQAQEAQRVPRGTQRGPHQDTSSLKSKRLKTKRES